MVPESQLSPGFKERSGEEKEKLNKYKAQQSPGSLRTQSKSNSQEKNKDDSSKVSRVVKKKRSREKMHVSVNICSI